MRIQRWMVLCVLGPAMASIAQEGNMSPVPAGMRAEAIDDPTLGMKAFEVFVPARWHFAGRIIQGTSCSSISFPVFRTTSPEIGRAHV